ncbi:MAG: helix-turn-helix transcriptional regulator [Acidobacteriota bacterium]
MSLDLHSELTRPVYATGNDFEATHSPLYHPKFLHAATPALRAIFADAGRVTPPIEPLLHHIAENLFDDALNVNQLKRACGVRNNSMMTVFRYEVGETPARYIERHRIETAARLIDTTQVPVSVIADMVGYADYSTFARAFRRRYEIAPTYYRERQRQATTDTTSQQ